MATSGSYNYSLMRDKIIKRAFQKANIYNKNMAIRADDMEYAVDIFQSMLKLWQAEGIQLWNRKTATLFPVSGKHQYTLSSTGDRCANEYVNTNISANEAAGQTVLTVTDTTGMSNNDIIGIELNSGARQWTTIVSVDSATQLTIAQALSGASDTGKSIVSYATAIPDKPLRIFNARVVDISNENTTTTVNQISYDEYVSIPLKSSAGRPVNYHYDKYLSYGTLWLYPQPDNVNNLIEFTYHESIEDVDSPNNNVDLPVEWTLPLIYNLAAELSSSFGKFQELPILKSEAKEYKDIVREFDNDEEPVFILPSNDGDLR